MSHQCFADAFAPWEANYKAKVIGATFGHLAPKKNKTYKGWMTFLVSCYGDIVIINSEWDGLSDSPWLYDAMTDFAYDTGKDWQGIVFRFDGTFRNYRFKGIMCECDLVPR